MRACTLFVVLVSCVTQTCVLFTKSWFCKIDNEIQIQSTPIPGTTASSGINGTCDPHGLFDSGEILDKYTFVLCVVVSTLSWVCFVIMLCSYCGHKENNIEANCFRIFILFQFIVAVFLPSSYYLYDKRGWSAYLFQGICAFSVLFAVVHGLKCRSKEVTLHPVVTILDDNWKETLKNYRKINLIPTDAKDSYCIVVTIKQELQQSRSLVKGADVDVDVVVGIKTARVESNGEHYLESTKDHRNPNVPVILLMFQNVGCSVTIDEVQTTDYQSKNAYKTLHVPYMMT